MLTAPRGGALHNDNIRLSRPLRNLFGTPAFDPICQIPGKRKLRRVPASCASAGTAIIHGSIYPVRGRKLLRGNKLRTGVAENAHNAADRIYRGIAAASEGAPCLKPMLAPYEWEQTTDHVDFDTTRNVYTTRDKCPVSHIVCDTGSWEQKVAQSLEELDEVRAYVKNDRLPGFSIPYTINGEKREYYPDFIARVNDGEGDDLLNVIVEVTGEKKKEKEAKVATARTLWVPAVNNHGGFGRWAFVEVTDPWRAKTLLREALKSAADTVVRSQASI